MGIDVGSTNVKATVVALDGSRVRELAVVERSTAGLEAAELVDAALAAATEALAACPGPLLAIGVASMAETGALVDASGRASGPLIRWNRAGDPRARLALARDLDPSWLHARTGAPLTPKLPLLSWAELVRAGLPPRARWAFAADLIGAALTGRVATDHTLAGRSGAYRLPAPGEPLPPDWDAELLAALEVPRALLGGVLAAGEAIGVVDRGLPDAVGVPVYLAGHDHAVAARGAGAVGPDVVVHSLGTTEAVLALAADGVAVDRTAAGMQGISVVRSVDGDREGVLAGSPAGGALIADWRRRASAAGVDPDGLLAAPPPHGSALALPYPAGRQCPAPDPGAGYELLDADPNDPAAELAGILRGLAAHGAWMRDAVVDLTGSSPATRVVATGAPVRRNDRLAGLMAALAGRALSVVDLSAPVAAAAAAIAAERAGHLAPCAAPFRIAEPAPDSGAELRERFARALAASSAAPSTTASVIEGAS
ncbi:MAG: FGGY family carbohydrate kinase [Protaetiibacter sp.]